MDRFVCVHGHFYQPPRENPWLEAIETQPSAYPFHDWNERIDAECYEPNGAARILDDAGRIDRLVNNYARISFNVGPTLLRWMQQHAPGTYRAVLDGDQRSRERFGGHGSALAQPFHHAILPLSNARDRATEVRWGLADFEHRFGRRPEGAWLPEAAVDGATLDTLAAEGLTFTILSPYQAKRVRRTGSRTWTDVTDGSVDPRRPYRVRTPSGRTVTVFFYDGPAARAVAFEGLLESGERFAQRLTEGFSDADEPQLVHIATDGESYGHHHRHGEMALAYALQSIVSREDVGLTNYAQYLEHHPPTWEAEIVDGSSWSCAHGIERWRADCGCATGGHPEWHQAWRAPLRAALNRLRDTLAPRYEQAAAELFRDPWEARDAYVQVVLDRSPERVEAFFADQAKTALDAEGRHRALRLLELQRHALMMYTSCGWFFDEVSRIEAIQVLHYAARAIQLADELFGAPQLERTFLRDLEQAPANDPAYATARDVYERHVRPSVVDLRQVAAHHAIDDLFDGHGRRSRVYCYEVVHLDGEASIAGRAQLALSTVHVRSVITGSAADFDTAVLHFGDHNIVCGVRPAGSGSAEASHAALLDAFGRADFPNALRELDAAYGTSYSLESLFRDEQNRIVRTLLDTTMGEVESTYRSIYRSRAPLMRFLADLGMHPPSALRRAAEVVINAELREALTHATVDVDGIEALIAEAARFDIELDEVGLAHTLTQTVDHVASRIRELLSEATLFDHFGEDEADFFARMLDLVGLVEQLPFDVDLWQAQNVYYRVRRDFVPTLRERAARGDAAATRWVEHFAVLGDRLGFVPDA